MKALLKRMLDPNEFLSDHGIRSLSRAHRDHPFTLDAFGKRLTVAYVPGESDSGMFGGNSNWRGPVWVPANYLLVTALRKFHRYYGDDFRVECPTGSGVKMSLAGVADEIARRVARLFLPGAGRTAPGPRRPGRGTAVCSTSTSTATPAAASGRPTRPAGRPW